MIRYPNIIGKTDAQKLEQMKSYLHQLADELNFQLDKTGSIGSGYPASSVDVAAIAKPVKKDDAISNFNDIKALIIKSADIVNAYSEEISKKLEGEYVAVSDFGTFKETTEAQLTASSAQVSSVLTKQEQIEADMGDMERELRSEIEQTAESIKLEVMDDTDGKTATIKLTVGKNTYSGQIDMTGLVTFSNLSNADGPTVIDGGNIKTGKILAEFIDVLNLVVGKLYAQNPSGSGITLDENGLQRSSADQTSPIIHLKHDWIQTSGFLEEKPYLDMFKTFFDLSAGSLVGGIKDGVHIDADGIEFRSDIGNFVDYPVHSYDHTVDFGINRYGEVTGRLKVDAPTDDDHVANKEYVDTNFAPAGCGYGDAMAFYNIQDGTFEATLDQVLAEMPNYSARQIQFIDAKGLSTQVYEGTLWKYTSSYAALNASNYNGTKATKTKYSTWRAWEFLNPGMVAGVENATLEKYNHKTVYTMVIDCKTLPSQGQKSVTTTIPSSANVFYVAGIAVKSDGEAESMPCVSSTGAIRCAFFVTRSKNIAINVFDDMSSYNGYVTAKYTKD